MQAWGQRALQVEEEYVQSLQGVHGRAGLRTGQGPTLPEGVACVTHVLHEHEGKGTAGLQGRRGAGHSAAHGLDQKTPGSSLGSQQKMTQPRGLYRVCLCGCVSQAGPKLWL